MTVVPLPLADNDASFARMLAGERSEWLRDHRSALYIDLQAALDESNQPGLSFIAERISKINAELRRRGDE